HDALISSCRSPVLLELANNLRQRAARYRYLSVKAEAQPQAAKAAKQQMAHPPRDVAAEHKALTDAALARDVDLACELLRRHLATTAELARQQMLARSAAAERADFWITLAVRPAPDPPRAWPACAPSHGRARPAGGSGRRFRPGGRATVDRAPVRR